MTAPIAPSGLLLYAMERGRLAGPRGDEGGGLASLAEASFREVVAEAILSGQAGKVGAAAPSLPEGEMPSVPGPTGPGAEEIPPSGGAGSTPVTVPAGEGEVILREAQRTGIDPSLLAALRRVENGGPGREFGILSVSAPGLEAQARVAANTIQRTLARFERLGGEAVDGATGRYTDGFLRFLSARYAPIGAANDPMGLNRFHAENLVALYRKAGGRQEGT